MASDQPIIDDEAFDAFEAAEWETRVAGYEDFFGAVTRQSIPPLLDEARIESGSRLLDIATGPGYVAGEAMKRGAEPVGVDVAEAMLSRARSEYPKIDFRRADAQALPFAANSFDAVTGNFALPHFSRPEQALAECTRVLTPGGRLALTTWDSPDRMRLFGVLLESVAEAEASPPPHLPAGPDVFRYSDSEAFQRLFGSHALDDVTVRRIEFDHPIESFSQVWSALLDGTVRMASLIREQPDDVRERIRSAFERRLERYRSGDGFRVPVSIKLAAGTAAR